jgi:hypothetical protein
MKYNNTEIFKNWYSKNKELLKDIIIISKDKKTYLELRFKGIIKNIYAVVINNIEYEISIWVKYCNNYDILCSFESIPKKCLNRKYYCKLCKDNKSKIEYFNSKEELIIDHVFEPFIEYAKNKIIKNNYLILQGKKNSYFAARIIDDKNFNKEIIKAKKENYLIAVLSLEDK